MVRILLLIAIAQLGLSLGYNVLPRHNDWGRIGCKICSLAVGFTALSLPLTPFLVSEVPSNHVARADSTGKMSTKLTAKKRYLPRIASGYQQLKTLLANPSVENAENFVKEELPTLERAMRLYGASLRKGEVPDQISRTADKLTADFLDAFANAEKSKFSPDSLKLTKSAIDAYLEFAKIQL